MKLGLSASERAIHEIAGSIDHIHQQLYFLSRYGSPQQREIVGVMHQDLGDLSASVTALQENHQS